LVVFDRDVARLHELRADVVEPLLLLARLAFVSPTGRTPISTSFLFQSYTDTGSFVSPVSSPSA
jgi:hypothetical protein